MPIRNYSNISKEGQLLAAVGTGDTTLTLTAPGLVNIPPTPFYVRIDPDTASEELILVGSGSSATTLLNCTRGYDGTSAFSHNPGAKIRHCVAAEFYNKADAHVEATSNVHGLSGGAVVVGTTQAQTVTNKTLNASVIDVAHSTSPAASQAIKVSADSATARDGFVWDNTGGSTGRSLVVRSGGVDRFVITSNGLLVSNSATGTDKAIAIQHSAAERFSVLNDGTADFGLQAGGSTVDRVTIRNRPTQNALRIKDESGFNIFTIGTGGNVDASGYVASAGAVSSGTTMSAGTSLTVATTSTLTGDVTLPLPAASTTPRLNVRGRTGGILIEGKDQAGTVTYSLGVDGGTAANGKLFIHDKSSPVVANVTGTGVVPTPVSRTMVFDDSNNTLARWNGASWDIVGRFGLQLANPNGLIGGQRRSGNTAAISTTETQVISSGSINLLASSLYIVEMDLSFFPSVTNDDFVIRVRDTNTSGTLRYQTVTYKTVNGTPYCHNLSFVYRTTSAETGRSFIGSVVRNAGSGDITVQSGTYLTVTYIGPTAAITDI